MCLHYSSTNVDWYGGLLGSSVSGVTSLVQYDGDVVLGHTPYTLTSCYASWWYAVQVLVTVGVSYLLHRPTVSYAVLCDDYVVCMKPLLHTIHVAAMHSVTLHTTTRCCYA